MSASSPLPSSGVQVESSLYTKASYCIPGRFAAYSYQIMEILGTGSETVLEIGPGNGVVTYVLRKAGLRVDTLDHDPELGADFVASVLDMPFAERSYDAVLCCQVLEHLPWDQFPVAMREMARVARKSIVMSIPQVSKYYFINFDLPRLGAKNFSWDYPVHWRMKFDGEHYWEIGKGVTEEMILAIFDQTGLAVMKSYRVPEHRYHHFYCLSKDKPV